MLSDLFYTLNFAVSIAASVTSLIFGCLIIITVITNRRCHTIANLLTCNNMVAIIIHSLLVLTSSIYGLRKDWLHYQPACVFRACCISMSTAAICYSYVIQAVSRLIYAVFYKYKHLQTYRIHSILITISWINGVSITFLMFLINKNVFRLVEEQRVCVTDITVFRPALFFLISGYAIPICIITIIYGIIFDRARQSTRRIVAFVSKPPTVTIISDTTVPNMKREVKLMRNIMILLSLFTSAGTPYMILFLWHTLSKQPPPEWFYLLCLNAITISIGCLTIAAVFTSQDIRKCVREYLRNFRQG